MTTNQTIDGVPREMSVLIALKKQQERDILRLYDTCEDGQGYDVPKDRMKSLARLGLIRSTGFSRYEITDAGDAVIEKLRALLDAPAENVIDVSAVSWDEIQKAASESTWMPPEYMRNDWVDDVCRFLREGPAAQPQGEPVGFRYRANGGPWELMDESPFADGRTHHNEGGEQLEPVYAEQPAPVAAVLTDEQILEAMRQPINDADGGYVVDISPEKVVAAARALIACLDEVTRLNTK